MGDNQCYNKANYLHVFIRKLIIGGDLMNGDKTEDKGVQIGFPEHLRSGVYCNNMVVSHTKEEFIMDFLMVAPPTGAVNARIIVSPGHIKRVVAALHENIQKYEQKFGEIATAEEPQLNVGFKQ
jgi:hypothetical protein